MISEECELSSWHHLCCSANLGRGERNGKGKIHDVFKNS